MSVGKGFTRPAYWAPVGSIVQTTEPTQFCPAGDWVVFHLTRGYIRDDDGTRWTISLSLLHRGDVPLYRVFRRGRHDYSEAWHQALPWMDSAR